MSSAVDTLIKAEPQAIILVSSGAAAAGLIEQYRARGGVAQLFVHSGANMDRVSQQIAEDHLAFVTSVMRGVAIAQVTPNPYKILSAVSKEFNDAIAKSEKMETPVSYVMMEGYIAAKVIVEAVRCQGRHATREGMVQALDSISGLDLGGHVVSYGHGIKRG